MTDVLTHRGPDDAGYLLLDSRDGIYQIGRNGLEPRPCDGCLGNRRLSILDLSTNGHQPMANETGDIFAVFNWEIFNYIELRDQLGSLGHIFRSQSDTEVIVHAYEEWGAECAKRFNGMWALAIWDQRRRELFCSRDRFGIKPFYYRLDDEAFFFASEVKGILPALDARPRPDYHVMREFLMNGALCRTKHTFFEGIKRLEPSHHLFVSARGIRRVRYWDYRTCSGAYDHRRPVETFRTLLDDAVRLRLRSDVPVGVALSGGLDSTSSLACAARGRPDHGLKAFTAVFPGEPFDEHKHALAAAHEVGAELFGPMELPVDRLAAFGAAGNRVAQTHQMVQPILRRRDYRSGKLFADDALDRPRLAQVVLPLRFVDVIGESNQIERQVVAGAASQFFAQHHVGDTAGRSAAADGIIGRHVRQGHPGEELAGK